MHTKHEELTVGQLLERRDRIGVNPIWQRDPVWNDKKKSLLIDSILKGYDVPKIYFRALKSSKIHDFEVVDGQQRLRAIWDFFDDKFELHDEVSNFKREKISGKTASEISENVLNTVQEFKFMICEIHDASPDVVSEIFSRMQMGVQLNSAELRNAIQKPLRHSIDAVALSSEFFKQSRIPPTRFKWQDYLAHAFSICFHDAEFDLKAPQLKEDYQTIREASKISDILQHSNLILDFLCSVNSIAGKKITQKWMFVDLHYLLFKKFDSLDKTDPAVFAEMYKQFDEERRQYNANPEILLEGRPGRRSRDLYRYILAFKISGGLSKNLIVRHEVLETRFARVLGG